MTAVAVRPTEGVSLRQAAFAAVLGYLLLQPVVYAEFVLDPQIVADDIAQTVQNIQTHGDVFARQILCYLSNYVGDIIIAWALYLLLAPVNRALSLLAAVFQWVYAALGLHGVLQLVDAMRLVGVGSYAKAFGAAQLQAQVDLLLRAHRYEWSFILILFGIHLVLVGYLIFRSGYLPKWLGIVILVVGAGWVITPLRPFLFPSANFGWFFIMSFGELLLPLWLLIMGRRIRDPVLSKP